MGSAFGMHVKKVWLPFLGHHVLAWNARRFALLIVSFGAN